MNQDEICVKCGHTRADHSVICNTGSGETEDCDKKSLRKYVICIASGTHPSARVTDDRTAKYDSKQNICFCHWSEAKQKAARSKDKAQAVEVSEILGKRQELRAEQAREEAQDGIHLHG